MIYKYLTFFFFLFLFNSCNECGNVDCLNDATCESGTCICAKGYEGTSCKNKTNDRYLGAYEGTQMCDGISKSLELSHVTAGINPWELRIISDGNKIDAEVSETEVTILEQSIDFDGEPVSVLPTQGKLIGNSLVFSVNYLTATNENKTCVYSLTTK